MSKENKADGECYGETFYINQDWRFEVPSLELRYNSYEEMRDSIERAQKAKESVARKKPMAIPVLTEDGKQTTITGIHAGHGKIIVKPKIDLGYREDIYPDVPWIREALAEKRRLRDQMNHIDSVLRKFEIDIESKYGFDPSCYPAQVEKVEKSAASALAAAEKTTLQKQLAATEPRKIRL